MDSPQSTIELKPFRPGREPADQLTRGRRPDWLRVRMPDSPGYREIKGMVRGHSLHTVCEEAMCPNIGECWGRGTATFLLGLRHAVLTSVNRDEQPDGGAHIFAEVIRQIRLHQPGCSIEVLIPDFMGNWDALRLVMDERPEILNHNTETVPRLYKRVRPQARYARSLELLRQAKQMVPDGVTKTGIMVGLGETLDEVLQVMDDLRAVDVDIMTVGQYLQPSRFHLPIERYWTPEEFRVVHQEGMARGFRWVESGPLVRSSYHADGQADQLVLKPLAGS